MTEIKRKFAKVDFEDGGYDDYGDPIMAEVEQGVSEEEANLIISRVDGLVGNYHMPALDLDVPHRLVPSSTPGHAHLYIDTVCSWTDYAEFLKAAEKIGILEPGYVRASLDRGFTALRKPGVYKNTTT